MPQIKEAFTLKKVFDNQSKSFRGALDDSIDDLDIQVLFPFSIREVEHNSGLNADFSKSLGNPRQLLDALLADY